MTPILTLLFNPPYPDPLNSFLGWAGWPLYFAPQSFINTRAFGTWFMFGLIMDFIIRRVFPHFWVM